MNAYMTFARALGIVILIPISIFGVYDIFDADVWAVVVIGYGVTYFPIALGLVAVSSLSFKRGRNWEGTLGFLGLGVGVVCILITVLYFFWNGIYLNNKY